MKKKTKQKALVSYEKPFDGSCTECAKYGHKLTDPKCPENNKKEEEKKRL